MVLTQVDLTANLEENSAALMTSDRGNSGGAELTMTSPVTPKTAGLNPNATVFSLSSKSSGTLPDTSHWDGVNANSEYQNANGDLNSSDQGGDITPPPESPLPDATGYLDNQTPAGDLPLENNFSEGDDVAAGSVSEDQLRHLLKQQLEVYFSRENLASDRYLQSQMDADQYVPIATVANLEQIQQLTSDLELIVELLRESSSVQVDSSGEKVRPNHNRCIVILREIPDTTPLEDVKELFQSDNCPKFVSCEFAHNNSWYVTFDSDVSAQKAYQYLREEVCTFLGKPIMARIKAKPLIRMTYPRNGYRSQYHQQQVQAQQQQQASSQAQTVVTSPGGQQQSGEQGQGSSTQQTQTQYQVQQQVPAIMPQYLNGNQPVPFFTNPLLQQWAAPTNHTLLDPSMENSPLLQVLAINGYQATSVKINPTAPRHSFSNVNRNRNQRPSRPSNTDHRVNTDSRHERQQGPVTVGGGMDRNSGVDRSMGGGSHRTSPRNSEASHSQTSGGHHSSPFHSQRSRGDNSINHLHMVHSTVQQPVTDNNSNIAVSNRQSESSSRPRSYRSRRRRDDDGARAMRPNSSQMAAKDARAMTEPQFDLEINSFPPLPGPGTANSSAAGDIFESKLSDVVKGTAKPQVRESTKTQVTPPPLPQAPTSSGTQVSPASPTIQAPIVASTAMTTTSSAPLTTRSTTPPQSSREREKEREPVSSVSNVPAAPSSSNVNNSTAPSRIPSPPITPQKSIKTANECTPKQTDSHISHRPSTNSAPKVVEKTATVVSSQGKLTYAQMLQRGRENEAAAEGKGNGEEYSEEVHQNGPSSSARINQTLKEQSQTSKQTLTANSRVPGKDTARRDFEPKDQRFGSARRAKENRERRDRHRDRRERDGSRSSAK